MVTVMALVMNASNINEGHVDNSTKYSTGDTIDDSLEQALLEYTGNEVYVQYNNGESKVYTLSHDNREELLEEFNTNEEISSVQPNYTYSILGTTIEDTDYAHQWALSNDGTFTIEENNEDIPIYENPFDEPMNQDKIGQGPNNRSVRSPYSNNKNTSNRIYSNYYSLSEANQVKAVSGIDINMEKAWEAYNGGKREVIVAVIDTGIDYSHEDLEDVIWTNEDEIAGDGIDNDSNGYIDDVYGWNFYNNNNDVFVGSEDSHGTHGAGTIAANLNSLGIAGIAGDTNIKVMSIKALGGSDGAGSTQSIISAIQYAEANGASICNLSFGTTNNDSALKKAIQNSDMLFVAAAGNGSNWTGVGQNTDQTPTYPAAYDLDNIISVANLQYDGTLHSSSNYGVESVDIAAPGTYIISTTPENTYSYMTGTSMAAPMVTGVAALVYSQSTDMSLSQVKSVILNSANELDSLENYVKTGGMLDAYAALTYDVSTIDTDTDTDSEDTTTEDTTEEEDTTVPVISAKSTSSRGRKYLTIQVTDEGNNLETVRYLSGKYTVEDFSDGTVGNVVTLNEDNSKTYAVASAGTFTFYAIDSAGNEVVMVIQVK